ncbi:uncharacterized protein LOC113295936 [Papaver somniferum]|uniref:uncharacterized protein LOC113295936 n=1 Tax=Papaver somniferum TaxID=3469 RepID=UPI000E6FABFA|nr:uncharacterized protein LOC113295936 [Papaver somniferum]
MDFIEGLPMSETKTVILVMVDILTKYIHFIGLQHTYTTTIVAKVFLNQVVKLHGLPASIVSNRDKVFTSHLPKKLFQWIFLAKWWYNTSYHTRLKMTPFKALYGYNLPHMAFPTPSVTSVVAVESYIKERYVMLDVLKETLQQAQARMKFFAGKNRVDRDFEVGERIYLKLQPYRQASVSLRRNVKLSARYYG